MNKLKTHVKQKNLSLTIDVERFLDLDSIENSKFVEFDYTETKIQFYLMTNEGNRNFQVKNAKKKTSKQ